VELDADLDPVVVVQEDLVLHTLVHSVKVIAAVVVSVDLLVPKTRTKSTASSSLYPTPKSSSNAA
jgi:hypothetical protein